jgi:hypothetical protein
LHQKKTDSRKMEISNFNQPEKSEIKLERNMRTPDSLGSDYLSELEEL